MSAPEQLQRLSRLLAVEFNDSELLAQALRHKSAGAPNNERLEFLGDAVLGQVIAKALYLKHPKSAEDGLSLMRASLVRRDSLAEIARELDLGRAIQLGSGELKSGGHQRNSILADAFEAILGAVYLDQGFPEVETLILRLFSKHLDRVVVSKDAKTRLQEYLQGRQQALPRYSVVDVSGADHARKFEVCCELIDGEEKAMGQATSRRAAEQDAAAKLLALLGVTS